MDKIILAGDVGGTKTLLQIAVCNDGESGLATVYEKRYPSTQFNTFDELLSHFLTSALAQNVPVPTRGCVGVAGPVVLEAKGNNKKINYIAKVTNLPWLIDADIIASQFNFSRFTLINDFQAVGYGLETLSDEAFFILQEGDTSFPDLPQPRVLIGAGTGLGQGLLIWQGNAEHGHYAVLGSEGGHGDFSPGSQEQTNLRQFLARKNARVSVEDVLSGRGLVNIYQYYTDKYPDQVSEALTQAMAEGDPAAAVSEAASLVSDSMVSDSVVSNLLAKQAMDLFVEIYGCQAGNLALTCMAKGGVFIAGGIAAKIQSQLIAGLFIKAFQDKGPMSGLMETIPVKLVLNPGVGLKGAALMASRM